MGIMEDYFNFKSKAEIEKEHQDYEDRMFPLGPVQKEIITQRIAVLFNNRKLTSGDLLFNFLVLKQAYMNADLERREKEYFKWFQTVTSTSLSNDEKAMMIALVNADLECEDLSSYKSADEIREDQKKVVLIVPETKKGLFSFLKK